MLDVGLYRLDQQVACQREAYHGVFFVCERAEFAGENVSPQQNIAIAMLSEEETFYSQESECVAQKNTAW